MATIYPQQVSMCSDYVPRVKIVSWAQEHPLGNGGTQEVVWTGPDRIKFD